MPSKNSLILRRLARRGLEGRLAALAAVLFLCGCQGGTLDAIYPGTLGHDPPPAINLPPQDQGMGMIAPAAQPAGNRP
jgi:hypothetical protein